jgi:ParB family transcriptional regulator, chromosome partitioning protein
MTRVSNTSRPSSPLSGKRLDVLLSKLVADPGNARRTKPDQEAHRRLVASIRSHGLLEPLVVRNGDGERYHVIAGRRRLRALRDVFKGQNPKVPCTLKPVEGDAADAVSLAENFAREPMHPLDEAEAFAALAKDDGKGAQDIAAQFGVNPAYVRQRMKLSALADVVKAAYRQGAIDTATAEAFSAVPAARQEQLWAEFNGPPQHAQQVRNRIDHAWIDSTHALFDLATLPEGTVSRDLFGDRVLVERTVFMEKQGEAILVQQRALQEDGWKDVVVGSQADVQDRLYAMEDAPIEYDKETTATLAKLDQKRETLDKQLDDTDADTDGKKAEAIQKKLDDVEAQAEELLKKAEGHYAEATKAQATVFLMLDPEGRVQRHYRIPRPPVTRDRNGHAGTSGGNGYNGHTATTPKPPTPADLSDPQKATLYTQQAIDVRAALLDHPLARKRLLVMMLHDKVRSEALSVRHDANGTTLHADKTEGFDSPALKTLRTQRAAFDPFKKDAYVEDTDAYARLAKLSEAQLDALITILTVEALTAHLSRPTALVGLLADELQVEVRQQWRPDDVWLSGYTKLQLADLLGLLRGPAFGNAAVKAKKSELVAQAATFFADAADGKLTDAALAKRVNAWLPDGVLMETPAAKPERKQAA